MSTVINHSVASIAITLNGTPMVLPGTKTGWTPVGLHWKNKISQLPCLEVRIEIPSGTTLDFNLLLGQPIEVSWTVFHQTMSETNRFVGLVTEVIESECVGHEQPYTLMVHSWLWKLTQNVRSRVFQDKSFPMILAAVLDEYQTLPGLFDIGDLFLSNNASSAGSDRDFPLRDYCVQYEESDFAFICRLMEEEGVFFHLDTNGQKVWFRCDSTISLEGMKQETGNAPIVVPYRVENGIVPNGPAIQRWSKRQRLTSGRFQTSDFSFLTSDITYPAELAITASPVSVGSIEHRFKFEANKQMVRSEYPAGVSRFVNHPQRLADDSSLLLKHSQRATRLRMQTAASQSIRIECEGNTPSLQAGYPIQLTNHPTASGGYLIVETHHQIDVSMDERLTLDSLRYRGHYQCLPQTLPFRSERVTPRPKIPGPQSAIVVGLSSGTDQPVQEITTDAYGRIRVLFPWSKIDGSTSKINPVADISSSCWIRVGQNWAGNGWGTNSVPRAGQEVIVAFENGDPDQPIAIGSVFNSQHLPPYTLPDNATIMGIKSHTPGTPGSFSGLEIQDKPNQQSVHLHSQMDMILDGKNDLTTTIQGDHATHVGVGMTEIVGAGIGISLPAGVVSGGISPNYRPRDGNLDWNLQGTMKIPGVDGLTTAGAESTSIARGPNGKFLEQQWQIQELTPIFNAQRFQLTIGIHNSFCTSRHDHATTRYTVVAPPFPAGVSLSTYDISGPLNMILKAKANESKVNWGDHLAICHDANLGISRGGNFDSVGQWTVSIGSTALKVGWKLIGISHSLQQLLPSFLPAQASSIAPIAAKLNIALMNAMLVLERTAGSVQQMESGFNLISKLSTESAQSLIDNPKHFQQEAFTLKNLGIALMGFGTPKMLAGNRFESTEGTWTVTAGEAIAMNADGGIVLNSDSKPMDLNSSSLAASTKAAVLRLGDNGFSIRQKGAKSESWKIAADQKYMRLGCFFSDYGSPAMDQGTGIAMDLGGKSITMRAGKEIKLIVGSSSIKITGNKITLESPAIQMKDAQGTSQFDLKASKILMNTANMTQTALSQHAVKSPIQNHTAT